jgi:hypothetical protein
LASAARNRDRSSSDNAIAVVTRATNRSRRRDAISPY